MCSSAPTATSSGANRAPSSVNPSSPIRFVPVQFDGASIEVFGSPIKLSGTPALPVGAAPALGQHNREVDVDWLGMSPERLRLLMSGGVVWPAAGPWELQAARAWLGAWAAQRRRLQRARNLPIAALPRAPMASALGFSASPRHTGFRTLRFDTFCRPRS